MTVGDCIITKGEAARMKSKQIIGGLGVIAVVGVLAHFGLIPGQKKQASAVPTAFTLAGDDGGITQTTNTPRTALTPLILPTTTIAPVHQPVLRFNIWEWNAQFGLLYSVGGPQTTKGSLTDKHGVTVKLTRQDDTRVSQTEQIKFAAALAKGDPNPTDGVQFTVIMGDQAAGYIATAAKDLAKLGDDYRAEVVGAVGYSYGEDACWGPQSWKDDPNAMRGGLIAGVLREGDWNICQYLLGNAQIKNNPDEKTWDPDAMNWYAADDYLKAAEAYNNNTCEDRKVVQNGKLTGMTKHVCIDGVTTWTPGDVNMAKGRGGLVRLLSTRENIYQMPAVIIGIHKFDITHAKQVQNMLAAFFEGSDQVKAYPEALSRAGQVSYAVYADQSAGYWVKYYKGTVERDKQNQPVPLGGSRVANLADNILLFGLSDNSGGPSGSLWKATYEGFGNIAKQQYPKLIPDFPPAEVAANTQFIQSLQATATPDTANTAATVEAFEDTGNTGIDKTNIVAARNWSIQFATGRADLTPAAISTLNQLYQQLVVGGALQVEIDGHTDNVGNPVTNVTLSEARANTVKQWMTSKAGKLFPDGRIVTKGFGDSQPVAPNTSEVGRSQNRRVTVILGTKN
jgi:OOP family OmpA-OmpF porin